eukprot:1183034-Rhodomonas_salina.1
MIWKRRKSLDAGQAMTEAAAAVGLQSRSQRNSDASSQVSCGNRHAHVGVSSQVRQGLAGS